jgi:hypothetical protein
VCLLPQVGSFPFTTILPNVGRGHLLVPDPTLAAGLDPARCRPLYGYAPDFSPAAAVQQYNNASPLTAWERSTGWGSSTTWRKVRQEGAGCMAARLPGCMAARLPGCLASGARAHLAAYLRAWVPHGTPSSSIAPPPQEVEG